MQTCLVAAILAGLVGTPAYAAVTVSLSDTAPTTNIEHSYAPGSGVAVGNTNAWYRQDKNTSTGQLYRSLGQAFTAPTTFDLSGVTLRLASRVDAGTQGKAIKIDVFALTAVNQAPAAPPISSQTGVLPTDMALGDYISFALDEEVALSEGDAYLVLFSFTEPTSTDASAVQLGFERTDGAMSSVGRIWTYDFNATTQSGFYAADSKAFTFYLQSVPEPAAAGLVASGAALGLVRHRPARRD